MRLNRLSGIVVIAMLAGAIWGCGRQQGLSPLSPSELSSRRGGDAPGPLATALAPRRVDSDGDGYEDPSDTPVPDRGADPGTAPLPNPDQLPPIDGLPLPVQLTINIIGTFGNLAFAPNPQQAVIGNMLVWTNSDLVPHTIVLDDGTPVGTLAPGQSSTPIALITETAGFHCTIHPSMVGQIVPMPVGEVLPPDGQLPVPPDGQIPMPPDYSDGYDDGYEDDYY